MEKADHALSKNNTKREETQARYDAAALAAEEGDATATKELGKLRVELDRLQEGDERLLAASREATRRIELEEKSRAEAEENARLESVAADYRVHYQKSPPGCRPCRRGRRYYCKKRNTNRSSQDIRIPLKRVAQ